MAVDSSGFKRKMAALNSRIPIIRKISVERMALFTERQMKKEAPVRTGRLRNSIEAIIQNDQATVGSSVKYAVMVARGTRPHKITPKSKKALAWAGGAHPVKSVNHPGTKANPYDLRALATLKDKATDIVNKVKREQTADLR